MEADLAEATSKEGEAKSIYETTMTDKTKEIESAGKAVESKTARSGTAAVETVQAKADLEKTEKALAEDIEFSANLAKNCATKQKEWDDRCKLRAEEIEAISDTIEMLNSDDALELFKKTLPSAAAASAFIQTSATTSTQLRRAQTLIRSAMRADESHTLNRHLMLAALRSGTGGFEKVVGMVDGMVGVLEGEQAADDKQDIWCLAELEKTQAEAKQTEVDISDLETAVDQMRDSIATVTSEMDDLKA